MRNELLGKKNFVVSDAEMPESNSIERSEDTQTDQEPILERRVAEQSNVHPQTSKRSPLQQRQPSAQKQMRPVSHGPDPVPPQIVPTLVKKSNATLRGASLPRSNEPELPPTPVQLGLDPPPDRPRGLSSSSPRGSKSGSGRRRVRALNGQSVTSSPLKQKAGRPVMHDLESQADQAREAPESQLPLPESDEEDLPEELEGKTQTLRSLRLELRKLGAEVAAVEDALNANDLSEEAANNSELLSLLKSAARPITSTNTDYEQESKSKAGDSAFNNLFSPGNLHLKTKTATRMVKGHAKIIHHVTITAPSPWPSHMFSATFEVVTDGEDACVEKVVWIDALKGHKQAPAIQDELHGWIQQRLKSELHCLDIGGLIWGIGEYIIASVERAKTFRALAKKYKPTHDGLDSDEESDDDERSESKDGSMSEDEATVLSKYLTQSQLTFEATTASDTSVTTRRSKRTAPKIMAIWKLQPTWHGEVKSICEIVPSGIPDSAQESVMELFESVKKVNGFEKAFGAVWDMVMQSVGTGEGDGKESVATKGPAKKRKRFS